MTLVVIVSIAWAALAASPFLVVVVRARARERARGLGGRQSLGGRSGARRRHLAAGITSLPGGTAATVLVGRVIGARRRRRDEGARRAELPVVVDLLNVAVGAGFTPHEAIDLAVRWAPPAAAAQLATVPTACRLGATLDEALRDAGTRAPALRPVTDTIRTAVRLGAPLAPALARLADEARADLRRAAEARARTVPVRLLFPLVFLVLPAFGLLTVVPALLAGFANR